MFANIFSWLPASWQWTEPIIGYSAVVVGLIYWIRLQLARRRRYANKGDCDFVVVVQVGRPVAEAAKDFFGEIDALIDSQSILSKTTLETDRDYKRLVQEFNRAIAPHQNSLIKVLLSGPVGLSALLGQSVGLQYNIVFHQFDAVEKQYVPLPRVERAWFR
ncbi:MAG: hypothetical protein ABH881_02285 [bacterium]